MKLNQIFRRLYKDWLNTSVIIISLAVGLGCVNLLILFINRELNTDDFQKNSSRIYMLKCDDPFNAGSKMFSCRSGAPEYMKENFSQVEDFCRISRTSTQKIIVKNETYYDSPMIYETSSNFFTFFTYELLTNNPATVLESKDGIAISEDLALKYFGEALPIGQIITLVSVKSKNDYVIKGVFRKPADNTQLDFDMVKYIEQSERYSFLLLRENANPADLELLFDKEKAEIPSFNDGKPGKYYLESLNESYFDTNQHGYLGPVRDSSDLWIAFIIGLMIIGVASFNYLGLINNKLSEKALEFNIRRINGASKFRLISEFILENLILLIISVVLGLEFISWIIPFFNELTSSDIKIVHFLRMNNLFSMMCIVLFLLLLTILISFSRISRIVLGSNLKALQAIPGKTKFPLYNIAQLTVSLVLLASSFVILKQIRYISNKDIGLDKEVIEVKLPGQYRDKSGIFKELLEKEPSVSLVSITPASPLLEHMMVLYHYTENGMEKQYTPAIFRGDQDFTGALGISIKEGRTFSGNMASDKNNCLINESFARMFQGKQLIGEKLPGDNNLIIIGIVNDFNYSALRDKIDPGIITFDNSGSHLLVKPSAGQLLVVRQAIKSAWQKIVPDYPLNIESVRERYEWYHRENANYAKLIGSCCLISLFLSMIGLFAISYNTSRKRTKEVGIRKINGATVYEVMSLLNRDFIIWVVVAFFLASPIAWVIMHKWLENYAYKTSLAWWLFALAGILAMSVTMLTVSWQSWRAATRNPVEALRYE